MTLSETIKRFEEIGELNDDEHSKQFLAAYECKQIAEWLKQLQAYKKCEREILAEALRILADESDLPFVREVDK